MLPKLISEDTPWLIEGGIALSAVENESVIINLVVNFGDHHQGPSLDSIEFDDPQALYTGAKYQDFQYQEIVIEFPVAFAVTMQAPYSNLDIIDSSRFDWSDVKYYEIEDDVRKQGERFQKEWAETLKCPSSHMFKVQNSDWLINDIERRGFRGYQHYIILSKDAYVEVIAKSWTWKSIGAVISWLF